MTQIVEDRIAGIEGIKSISSSSRDGSSRVTIEFTLTRDIDAAANDVRDRVSRILNNLPEEADPPEISKVDSDTDAIMWFSLASPVLDVMQLTDYADRFIVDRLSVADGVATVRIGGQQRYSMRVHLDRQAMAARNLTATDIENALRSENVELPAGRIESTDRNITVRVERDYKTAQDFSELVLGVGDDGHLIRLGEVARVELGAEDDRTFSGVTVLPAWVWASSANRRPTHWMWRTLYGQRLNVSAKRFLKVWIWMKALMDRSLSPKPSTRSM
ncbi:hypothetical protein JCM17844_29460 [Iodidimonas gelatinilytica]|uniref:Uncharacterized protein n=1 Tax=Iodidimonas gelatinilytica TaxID=1236966 RepID=A0A5A7MWM3_9PROT|nr:efflux RND transporter permease subunit [Iodidimonas gelatinilytica]GEQ99309.1 hypothetical protein JCM17844_29460 [Iodidimonas gelatinilytica]